MFARAKSVLYAGHLNILTLLSIVLFLSIFDQVSSGTDIHVGNSCVVRYCFMRE